ncbi:MAG: hypothetical protein H0W06_10820 [Chloroflexia bacterium]|nr:hypothetical protein [Chloroflexia bacterium]
MRKLLAILCATLFLMGGSASLVAAQDAATPAAPGAEGGSADPAVGDTVSVVDSRGNEYVTVSVTEVVRP